MLSPSRHETLQYYSTTALQHYSITVAAELSSSELLRKVGTLIAVQNHINHKLNLVKCSKIFSSADIIGAMKQGVDM
jgi:hypothetical protein